MKIRITGRFGEPAQRGCTTVAAMHCRSGVAPVSRMPEGLPPLPDMTVMYTIMIAPRHWRVVTDRSAEYEVEGICLYDAELKGLTVIATSVKPRSFARRS